MVPSALITGAQKQELLQQLGVDVLVDIPFNQQVADLSPQEFLQRLQQLDYSCLVVGANFTYGCRGQGTVYTLAASANAMGFELIVRELVSEGATVISSTAIRHLIAAGEVAEAAAMLGRSYSISGTVAHGNERGRLLGYPTANIELEDAHVAVPLGGVYAVRVIVNGKNYHAWPILVTIRPLAMLPNRVWKRISLILPVTFTVSSSQCILCSASAVK